MGKVELSEADAFELEASILREAYHQERVAHAETTLRLTKDILGHVRHDKELLARRLKTQYGLDHIPVVRLGSNGKTLEYDDPIPDRAFPEGRQDLRPPSPTPEQGPTPAVETSPEGAEKEPSGPDPYTSNQSSCL